MKKNKQSRRAATLVEFALVFPVFVVLIMGTLDLARYMFIEATMSHVVRTALRYGITERQDTDIVNGKQIVYSVRESILNAAAKANPVGTMVPLTAGASSFGGSDTFYIDIASPTANAWKYAAWSKSPPTGSPWVPLKSSTTPMQMSGQLLRITFNHQFTYITPLFGRNKTRNISVQTIYRAENY